MTGCGITSWPPTIANRTAVMYVDGVLQGAMYVPADYTGTTNQLCFGNNIGADQPYAGALDEFHVLSGVPDAVKEIFAFDASLRTLRVPKWKRATTPGWNACTPSGPFRRPRSPSGRCDGGSCANTRWRAWGYRPSPIRSRRAAILPLDARLGSASDSGDFTVQGIRIQTWQGIYAFGYLYLPKTGSPPYPAILNPNGHFAYESRDPVVQSRCIGLAKKGSSPSPSTASIPRCCRTTSRRSRPWSGT
ncbi:hypothetical protein HS125_09325 [bacterium]|nr:hypothetical protein [bacterium]